MAIAIDIGILGSLGPWAGHPCDDHPDPGQSQWRRPCHGSWGPAVLRFGFDRFSPWSLSIWDGRSTWGVGHLKLRYNGQNDLVGGLMATFNFSKIWLWWWLSRTNIFVRWGSAMLRKGQTPNWPMVLARVNLQEIVLLSWVFVLRIVKKNLYQTLTLA